MGSPGVRWGMARTGEGMATLRGEKLGAYVTVDILDKGKSVWAQVRVVKERGRFYLRVGINDSMNHTNLGHQFIKLESYEAQAFIDCGVAVEEKK